MGINRTKLAALCPCTCRIACKGVISVRVLQKLLGLWAFAMQFRRPLFSLLHVAYHVSHRDGDDDAPFRMPRDLQQALQLTSILGFLAVLAFTDLKTQVASQVFASDASPEGAGIVACNVGATAARELFRRADTRGFHTRLLSSVSEYLHPQGHVIDEPSFLISQDYSRPCPAGDDITPRGLRPSYQ